MRTCKDVTGKVQARFALTLLVDYALVHQATHSSKYPPLNAETSRNPAARICIFCKQPITKKQWLYKTFNSGEKSSPRLLLRPHERRRGLARALTEPRHSPRAVDST